MQNGKTKKPVQQVHKPYLTGSPYDRSVPKSALMVVLGVIMMAVAFLFLGALMMLDIPGLKIAVDVFIEAVVLLMFYYAGISNGSVAVNQGEIMYRRRETEREVTADELSRCYHPLKGFVIGLLGCAPAFIMALILALTTSKVMTGYGALPSWVSNLNKPEVAQPISFYTAGVAMNATSIVRVLVRMILMPLVNLVGAENADGLLVLERISPILVLLPGLSYGFGYTQGTKVRTKVHTDIAEGRKKAARKARRQKKAKQRVPAGPQQLN
ncbi:MAG: hypothetical protein IKP40_12340 [Clostridia bacterium]|nr:hypothetical protein [Clostridia bacterium]